MYKAWWEDVKANNQAYAGDTEMQFKPDVPPANIDAELIGMPRVNA